MASLGRAAAWQGATPGPLAVGDPLGEPPVLRSANGRLDVTLEAGYGPAVLGGRPVTTHAYGCQTPGPTLRLRAGDTLGAALTNRLDAGTNLHTHGLHVSPAGTSDNVLLDVEPGETVEYSFAIPPNGTSGLYIPGFYWYHPHLHGDTAFQVGGGMAGALIVDGPLDELPGIAGLTERVLVLNTAEIAADGTLLLFADMLDPTVFVNGQAQPTIAIAPGETQRWRILNASVFTFMNLALDGHQLHQIAAHGNPLRAAQPRPDRAGAGRAGRGAGPGRPCRNLRLPVAGVGQDLQFQAQDAYPLATLVSGGAAVAPAPLPTDLLPFEDLRAATIDRRREVVFSESFDPFRLFIDGKTFDHDRVDQTVEMGATEEWRLVNTSPDTHPFQRQRLPGSRDRRGAGRCRLLGGHHADPRFRRDRDPDALPRLRRDVRLPLPHPRPRRQGHDGHRGGRGGRRVGRTGRHPVGPGVSCAPVPAHQEARRWRQTTARR